MIRSSMTTILALDCATGPCSAAVYTGGRIAAYVENLKPIMQSASLIPMVEDVLRQSGRIYQDIDLVAATVGPGSFTGIRVALAGAQGIAYAASIPTAGFTTLEVLAFSAKKDGCTLAILQAGKGEYYYQYYMASTPLAPPQVGTLERALSEAPHHPVTVAGNAHIEAPGFTLTDITFPRADILAQLAASGQAGQPLRPFYIRPPDAKLPTKKPI